MQTFNEFQKELQRRNIQPQEAYLFSMLYEQQIDLSKQIDMAASLISALVETVQNFASLRERDQGVLKELMRRHMTDGVEVKSVANDPEE